MVVIKSLLFFIFTIKFTTAVLNQNLGGDDWLVKDEGNEYTDLRATVPGGIYTDLMKNDVLEDVFYGYNDVNTRWVSRKNWTYTKKFSVSSPSVLLQEKINIVFEGVDTFSTVYLNDVKVGETSNMFVQYVFSIKDVLKSENNVLEVRFQSPIEAADNLATVQNKDYVIPPECPAGETNGDCHVNMIRKMQASYSWDWGPSFPSVGIWKNVSIEAYNESVIRYVVVDIEENSDEFLEDTWIINADVYLANNSRAIVQGELEVEFQFDFVKKSYTFDVEQQPNDNDEIVQSISIEIVKGLVKSWWPNGYGTQNLYDMTVTFRNKNYTEESFKSLKIGFRTVELVQTELDSGLTFYFKVNGVPIFMKGSNEIPVNILPELDGNRTVIRNILESARDANMNTLRVWGGGVYESDYFYEVTDELGIIIWQDFMFACALYPSNEGFLSNVVEEVRHQIKRLKSHPSIVIYSGNNENEAAIAADWYGIAKNSTVYKNDYVKLYHDTIEKEFTRITHNKSIFITSSPTNGKESIQESYLARNPGSSLYGDVHFYEYALNPLNPNIYPIPRFASEYGYQSLPSVETLLTATNNTSDLNIQSEFIAHRQHHPGGNAELLLLMDYNLKSPQGGNYAAIIYYLQIIQAMGIKTETERYRSRKSILDDNGQGYTRGALYWQLNDVWVAPSWSSIDYTGRWKMLHYFAKNFFSPLIVIGEIDVQRQLNVYLVSDLLSPIENVTVVIEVYGWNSFDPVSVENVTIDINADESRLVISIEVDDYLSSLNCGSLSEAKSNCFFYLSVKKNDLLIGPQNFALPNTIKDSNIVNATVQIVSVEQVKNESNYQIELSTNKIALFVWLDSHSILGRFSENGFILTEEKKIVYFVPNSDVDIDVLKTTLTVTHLTNVI